MGGKDGNLEDGEGASGRFLGEIGGNGIGSDVWREDGRGRGFYSRLGRVGEERIGGGERGGRGPTPPRNSREKTSRIRERFPRVTPCGVVAGLAGWRSVELLDVHSRRRGWSEL